MKLTVQLLILAAISHAAKVGNIDKKAGTIERTDKRDLTEGNVSIEKRTPVLPTFPPAEATGAVVYADSKDALPDKSPTQQIYATPVPQIAKISDVFSGQGPPFQTAIASHLYSPISAYQPRLGSPTRYEVSAPIPSNLAYSEHGLSLPSPNAIQYDGKPQRFIKPIVADYNQPQVQNQPSYDQNLAHIQSNYQGTSTRLIQNQPIKYTQTPQQYSNQHQLQFIQEHPNQLQSGTVYQQEQFSQGRNNLQLEQRDIKSQPAPAQLFEKQSAPQVYNNKQQPALSYARFTVNQGPPSNNYNQLQQIQQAPQPQSLFQANQQLSQTHEQYKSQQQLIQPQLQQYQPPAQPLTQIDYQLQHSNQPLSQIQYQSPQNQLQQLQYQSDSQPQQSYQQLHEESLQQQPQAIQEQSPYDIQQYQYQQPQLFNVEKSEPLLSKQSTPEGQNYFKQIPFSQPQSIPPVHNLANRGQPAVLPTFPPIQYFGKFAHSIFGNYQH